MKKLLTTGISILILFTAIGQPLSAPDALALKIPEPDTYSTNGISTYVKTHFPSDSERVRALFVWVANNISYDVEKFRNRKNNTEKLTTAEILKLRKGVCQDYSELLLELCNQCNIRSMMVSGYGKLPDGSITETSHAWLAAEVNNKWYFFDATWSAGGVRDGQFTKRFTNRYYKVPPEEMIKDHMPFDPMFQLLNYPLRYNEFNEGKTDVNTRKTFFNYVDTLTRHNALEPAAQSRNIARRIKNNGVKLKVVEEMLEFLNVKQGLRFGYEEASSQYQLAISLFNRYIQYKNNRFAPFKEDKEIQQTIDSVWQYIVATRAILAPLVADTDDTKRILSDITNSLFKFSQRVDEEKIFVKRYLQTDKSLRSRVM